MPMDLVDMLTAQQQPRRRFGEYGRDERDDSLAELHRLSDAAADGTPGSRRELEKRYMAAALSGKHNPRLSEVGERLAGLN